MMSVELEVIVHRDSDKGDLWAEVVQLPGCFASGKTREELMDSLQEAIKLYLENGDASTAPTTDRVDGVERYRVSKDFKLVPAS